MYRENKKEEWPQGITNNDIGEGCPDGTHPSDYSKGKKANDMHASTSNGITGEK